MSERVRLVNQQLAFSQSHLQAARLSDGFMRRCQLQACKLQMYLMIHAYLAEIAERSNLKWELLLGDVNTALEQFAVQMQQQGKVSSDYTHFVALIHQQQPSYPLLIMVNTILKLPLGLVKFVSCAGTTMESPVNMLQALRKDGLLFGRNPRPNYIQYHHKQG